jgi:hypothetical protein
VKPVRADEFMILPYIGKWGDWIDIAKYSPMYVKVIKNKGGPWKVQIEIMNTMSVRYDEISCKDIPK